MNAHKLADTIFKECKTVLELSHTRYGQLYSLTEGKQTEATAHEFSKLFEIQLKGAAKQYGFTLAQSHGQKNVNDALLLLYKRNIMLIGNQILLPHVKGQSEKTILVWKKVVSDTYRNWMTHFAVGAGQKMLGVIATFGTMWSAFGRTQPASTSTLPLSKSSTAPII